MDEWHIGDPVDWGEGFMDAQNWGHEYSEDEEEDDEVDLLSLKINEYSKKAWDYYLDGKYNDAHRYIDLALDLNDKHANNWNIKGIIWEAMGIYGSSEECYNKSLELSPSNIVYENKARMLRKCADVLYQLSKTSETGLMWLEDALKKNSDAINILPKDSKENLDDYLRQKEKLEYYIDYEKEYQKNLETLKKYDKSELFTITGINFYKNKIVLTSGMDLKLVREPDKDAIAVYTDDAKIGYVANNDYTKYELTSSASELQDKIQNTAQASYLLHLQRYADIQFTIGRILK